MANAITSQTIIDGQRDVIVKITITGDGSGDETDTVIFDASSFTPAFTDDKLMKYWVSPLGFTMKLSWDATANIPIVTVPSDHDEDTDFTFFGGIVNNTGAGKTGDILLTTTGLGAGDVGYIVLSIKKKGVPVTR